MAASPTRTWNRATSCTGSGGSDSGFSALAGLRTQPAGGVIATPASTAWNRSAFGRSGSWSGRLCSRAPSGETSSPLSTDVPTRRLGIGSATTTATTIARRARRAAGKATGPTWATNDGRGRACPAAAGLIRALSKCPDPAERYPSGGAEHQVVHHLDTEEPAGAGGLPRRADVVGGGRWVAAGMVVRQDDVRCLPLHRLGEELGD